MKKNILFIIMILVILTVMCSCSTGETEKLPIATHLGGEETIDEITNELEDAGLSNLTDFQNWVSDFAKTAGKTAGLKDSWEELSKLDFDSSKTMDGWEKNHDYSDSDCRMTAFLLMDGILESQEVEEKYDGTYLMFDMEAIDSVARYEKLKNKRALFTTIFGDKVIADGENPKDKLGEIWKQYGIKVNNDKASLLSLVIYDPDFKTIFVGHTGVLVTTDNGLLFVEKIAFEQPYQATRVNDMKELMGVLAKRGEYFGEQGESGPYVYVNGEFYAELKK